MKFSKAVERRVLAAFMEKLPEKRLVCPLCKAENWVLTRGFITLPVQRSSDEFDVSAGTAIVAAALSCTNCGNTHFLNLINLDIFEDHEIVDEEIEVKF